MVPTPESLPVNWLWFQLLLVLTFSIHLILMNILLGSSIISSYNFLMGKKDNQVAKTIPTLIALTVNFGVPPLLFVQVLYGHFFYSSSIVMGVPWFLIIPFIIIGYYGAYIYVMKREITPRFSGISMVIATIILLYIGFMMSNNFTLMVSPESWDQYFNSPAGLFLNLSEPTLIPRYLHFVVAAVAMGGLWRSIYAKFKKGDQSVINSGLKIFSYATIIQIVVGLWFLFTLPNEIIKQFMGGDIVATLVLVVGALLGITSAIVSYKLKYRLTIITSLLTIVVMVIHREFLQSFYLDGKFSPSDLTVEGEYSSLILFLITFVIGVYALYYMISLIFRSKEEV